MRFYTFCNYYISSIQQGIQTAHAVHEIFNKYVVEMMIKPHPWSLDEVDNQRRLVDWSLNHKTIITLNGGNCDDLSELLKFFEDDSNPFPYVYFEEDKASLNSAITCVGIVLPEEIYNAAELIRKRTHKFVQTVSGENVLQSIESGMYGLVYTQFEMELIERLNSCGLAK